MATKSYVFQHKKNPANQNHTLIIITWSCNDNNNDNDNDIFIILTCIYIAKLHNIISLKLLPNPEGLISQFKNR